MLHESATSKPKLDIKGLAITRGDSSKMTKALQLAIIEEAMEKHAQAWPSCEKIILDAKETIRQQDISYFIKTKKLGSDYKYPERQVQYVVAEKMRLRGENAPNAGERVSFVVGKGEGNICKRADSPEHIKCIDYDYCINAQIDKPIKNIINILQKEWEVYQSKSS